MIKNTNPQSQDYAILLKSALNYLKYRQRLEVELVNHLSRKHPKLIDLIEQVIDYLQQNRYLNDNQFYSDWIRSQLNKGKGRNKPKQYCSHQLSPTNPNPILPPKRRNHFPRSMCFSRWHQLFLRSVLPYGQLQTYTNPITHFPTSHNTNYKPNQIYLLSYSCPPTVSN